MWLASLFALTVMVLLLPLLPALAELWFARDIRPLRIVHDHDGNPRHFAEGFRQFVAKELENLSTIGLCQEMNRGRTLLTLSSKSPDGPRSPGRSRVEHMLFSEGTLALPDGCDFTREVYARGDVRGGNYNRFRAVLAEGKLYLRHKSMLTRWAHADSVYVSAYCRVIGRVTADSEIVIDPTCRFYHLHAPTIRFGGWLGHVIREESGSSVSLTRYQARSDVVDECGRWLIPQDIQVPAYSVLQADLIVQGALNLGMGSVVVGNIKAHGKVRLEKGVRVTGALVSEAEIEIGSNGDIAGPVVSETGVWIGAGTTIGSLELATSVTAPEIQVGYGVIVHGTVWARGQQVIEGQGDG